MAINLVKAAHVSAAGILFYCKSTGNFLLLYRSKDVVDGSCWCGAGGKIEDDETPEDAARREIQEEIGFDTDGLTCIPLYAHQSEKLTFYNFLCVVDEQFFPELNWESDGYVWAPLEDLPKPFHYGFQEILNDADARAILKKECKIEMPSEFVGAEHKRAAGFHTRLKKLLKQE